MKLNIKHIILALIILYITYLIYCLFFCSNSLSLKKIKTGYFQSYGVITHKGINRDGLGNHLFEFAAVLGIARNNNLKPIFPKSRFKYLSYFRNTNTLELVENIDSNDPFIDIYEEKAGFSEIKLDNTKNYNLSGYRQSYLYFENIKNEIINLLQPDKNYLENIKNKFPILNQNNTVSVHIRRGDYIILSDYFLSLSEKYYLAGLNYIKNIVGDINIVIVSDDKQWVQNNMHQLMSLNNVYMSPFNDQLEDFSVLYLCKYHINANSSYSWWASYLSESKIVIAPAKYYINEFENKNTLDIFPSDWILIDNEGKIINRNTIITKFSANNIGNSFKKYNDVIIMLLSCKKNISRLPKIKSMWLDKLNIKYVILMGDVNLEKGKFNYDIKNNILYIGCEDNYDELTHKVYYGLKYIKENFNPDKVFKIDDDILININNFYNYLDKHSNSNYEGKVVTISKGLSYFGIDKYSQPKNKEPTNIEVNVTYCGGPIYFLNKNSIDILLQNMDPNYIKFEDVNVGYNLNKFNIYPVNTDLYSDNLTDYDTYPAVHGYSYS